MTRDALPTAALLFATWLGVNAIWGLTGPSDTLVSGLERRLLPLEAWIAAAAVLLAAAVVSAGVRRARPSLAVAAMLLAYLGGVLASRWAKLAVDPPGGVPMESLQDGARALAERSFVLLPAIPMLLVGLALCRRSLPLRFGDWSVPASTFGRAGERPSWGRALLWVLVLCGAPGFLLLQWSVGFEPLTSGRLTPVLLPLAVLALFNSLAEELLFRGLLQGPLVARLGATRGIWLQALFFGLHHWGASPGPVAALPMAVLITLVAVLLGRSALETRGLGWAICLHAMMDLAFFSAYFVPRG